MRWVLGVLVAATAGAVPELEEDTANTNGDDIAEMSFYSVNTFGRALPIDAERFSMPSGVGFDAISGDIYIAETGNSRVSRLAADGSFLDMWHTTPLTGIVVNPLRTDTAGGAAHSAAVRPIQWRWNWGRPHRQRDRR